MKNKLFIISLAVFVSSVMSSCQPVIYGNRPVRERECDVRQRDCPQPVFDDQSECDTRRHGIIDQRIDHRRVAEAATAGKWKLSGHRYKVEVGGKCYDFNEAEYQEYLRTKKPGPVEMRPKGPDVYIGRNGERLVPAS